MSRVTLEPIIGYLVRYYDNDNGPHSFSVVVALEERNWWFKGATGHYCADASRRIRYALSRAGFHRISRLSGWGAHERVITTEALKMKDLRWQATVTAAGYSVGFNIMGWDALPLSDYNQLVKEGTQVVTDVKAIEKRNGGYVVEFTGSARDTDTGVITLDPVIRVELDGAGHVKYLERVMKFARMLVDWAKSDIETEGKKFGWDHTKGKKVKPKVEGAEAPITLDFDYQ